MYVSVRSYACGRASKKAQHHLPLKLGIENVLLSSRILGRTLDLTFVYRVRSRPENQRPNEFQRLATTRIRIPTTDHTVVDNARRKPAIGGRMQELRCDGLIIARGVRSEAVRKKSEVHRLMRRERTEPYSFLPGHHDSRRDLLR